MAAAGSHPLGFYDKAKPSTDMLVPHVDNMSIGNVSTGNIPMDNAPVGNAFR